MKGNNKEEFQKANVTIISFSHMLHDIYTSFLAPLLPLLREKFGLSYSLLGLLTLSQRVPSIFNPLVGIMADRVKMRFLVIITPAASAVFMSLLGLAPNYLSLLLLLFLSGISSTLFHVPSPVMITKISGKRIGKGMAFYMLGGETARTLGPLIIMAAVSAWTLEGTWKLIPFGLTASLILYFRFKNIHISEDIRKKHQGLSIAATFKQHRKFFLQIFAILFFQAFLKSSITAYLPAYMKDQEGSSLWMGAIALSLFQFAGMAGTYLSGTLSDKVGRKKIIIVSSFAMPLCMMLFIFSSHFMMIPFLILLGLFVFANSPVLLALVNELKSDRPAFINGMYMGISFVVTSSVILLIGILFDYIGLFNTYLLASILSIFSIPFVFKLNQNNNP